MSFASCIASFPLAVTDEAEDSVGSAMGWHEFKLNDWQDFQKWASRFVDLATGFKGPYIYRGQPYQYEQLKPSLLRYFNASPSREIVRDIEKRLVGEFESRAHEHLKPNLWQSLKAESDRWSVMQHYGAPTRFLDWTKSIYVAAYFSCVSEPKSDGAIWGVHIETVNGKVKNSPDVKLPSDGSLPAEFDENLDPRYLCAVNAGIHSDRMAAQQGVFTYSNDVLADHAELIDANIVPDLDPNAHFRLVIGHDLKNAFLKQLHAMNITPASLFPGLEGLGRSLQDRARLAGTFGV